MSREHAFIEKMKEKKFTFYYISAYKSKILIKRQFLAHQRLKFWRK